VGTVDWSGFLPVGGVVVDGGIELSLGVFEVTGDGLVELPLTFPGVAESAGFRQPAGIRSIIKSRAYALLRKLSIFISSVCLRMMFLLIRRTG
jgi:hypothetical protein